MERYNEYKDSSVQWLGEIPSHWECEKAKRHFQSRKQIVGRNSSQYERLALTLKGVIKRFEGDGVGLNPEKLDTYQIVDKDDLIFKLIDLENVSTSRVGLSPYKGIVSPAYIRISAVDEVNIRFAEYYYLNMWMRHIFNDLGTPGVRSNLSSTDLLNLPLLYPSIVEQKAIATYLDKATAKIDEAIAQQQKMIDLLNERKQIIINNAVTKGLNHDAPMKDSGVEWIGEIPEHWEVMKLKHVTSKIGSGSTPRGGAEVYQDSGIMFLRSQNVYNDGLKLDDVAHIVDGVHQKMKGTQVKYNDILYNITGGSIGRCCCYDREDEANVNQHVSIVRPKGIIAKYLMYNLQSDNAQRQLRETLKGGNREGLAAVTFKEFLILTCPKEEQNQIVSHIERMFVNIDRAISNATKQISLLQERKQIIINDVVTGKVKVS